MSLSSLVEPGSVRWRIVVASLSVLLLGYSAVGLSPIWYVPVNILAAVLLLTGSVLARQPNIIYINTDDWGIGKVPCYDFDAASTTGEPGGSLGNARETIIAPGDSGGAALRWDGVCRRPGWG